MILTPLHAGLASPAYDHLKNWIILRDGREVGRLYEEFRRELGRGLGLTP
jgi:hypothetical protein